MSDTGQPEDGRCKHVMIDQLGTRFLTRKEAAILRRRPKKIFCYTDTLWEVNNSEGVQKEGE